ncbi:polysaccharide pyruvyl transferase family protein [Chitinimonas sp. PSY-7]|uniref:polysaccharide pyruvyl transferase family protein n=1 Tax=Chitinimonas sp. PSY-7 TaxID=3459088 RepID=UPI004040036D
MSKLLEEFMLANAAYPVLYRQLQTLIDAAAAKPRHTRTPGEPLRLLFVGYAGGGNTGADIRVAEMIRQVRAVLGREQVRIGLVVSGDALPPDLQDDIELEVVLDYFPEFLARTIDRYDGVIACDGSMFKSNLCCMLSAMMGGALGMAAAAGKLAIGYGAEAGRMEPDLKAFIASLGKQPLILCRNVESRAVLEPMGMRVADGADTAWTYQAEPLADTQQRLAALGVDKHPILVVCPMNPFWWPVRPDLAKAMEMQQTGAHQELHFGSILFHPDDASIQQRYHHYLDGLASAANTWQKANNGSVVVIGMDKVDRTACNDLAKRLVLPASIVVSGDVPPTAIVGLLRSADLMISSRFHAIVASMEAGVPAIGVSMDERIANLLGHDNAGHCLLKVDAPDLAVQLVEALRFVETERKTISQQTQAKVARNLLAMAEMGKRFADEVRQFHPDMPLPVAHSEWDRYLPPLSIRQAELITRYG